MRTCGVTAAAYVRWFSIFFVACTVNCACKHNLPRHSDAEDRAKAAARRVRNSDVAWHGGVLGLTPQLQGEASTLASSLGEPLVAPLLDALADPERFVAAHVLLTKLTGEYELIRPLPGVAQAGKRWNGLRVQLHADGSVTYDPDDIPILQRRWHEWHNRPRPATDVE